MKKILSISLLVLSLLFVLIFWRITANESALEEAIRSVKRGENSGQINMVTISLLGGKVQFNGLKIPLDSLQSVNIPFAEIYLGRLNMLRLAMLNPKSIFESGESISVSIVNPVLIAPDKKFSFASSISLETNGDVIQAFTSYLTNKPMQQNWRIHADLYDVTAWKANQQTDKRAIAVPLFDKVSVSVEYQAGLRILQAHISGMSSTQNQMMSGVNAFYDPTSSIKKPYKTEITLDYNGAIPAEIPLVGLEGSTISSDYVKINGQVTLNAFAIQESGLTFRAENLFWTPPKVWPKSLAPAYFIFGAQPKPVRIDSLRFETDITDKKIQLNDFRLYGSVMNISSDIYAPKLPNSSAYLFEAATVEVFFRTPESVQLAQMLLKYSGQDKVHLQNNRLRVRLRGTSEKPVFTSY